MTGQVQTFEYQLPVGKDLRDFEARPVAGTEGGFQPFFSTDAEWLGFAMNQELRKVSVNGGLPLLVAAWKTGFVSGARSREWD